MTKNKIAITKVSNEVNNLKTFHVIKRFDFLTC